MSRSYVAFGQELAPYVIEWGQVEEVKDVLLAQSQLFTAEHTLVLANADNRFSPNNSKSIFYGHSLQLYSVSMAVDGVTVYQGFIRSIDLDHANRTASIVTQNALTVPANSTITMSTAGNPASIIKGILVAVGLESYLDASSFAAAAGPSAAVGASIAVSYAVGGGTSALSAIQAISSLCSLSCYVSGGVIKCKAWQPYQGNLAGIKYQITPALAYDFGTLSFAYQNLSNSVNVLWGASGDYYALDSESKRVNGIETNTQFSTQTGGELSIPDLLSATYFGNLFLARASTLRKQGSFKAGVQLLPVTIGDRITVSAPNWSDSPIAFEVIETHQDVVSKSVDITCATI